jgi:dihydroxy-acid dehydratase
VVRNGDRIRLSVAERRLDLLVDDAELERRRQALAARPRPEQAASARGYGPLYARHVPQAQEGCDFDFLRR